MPNVLSIIIHLNNEYFIHTHSSEGLEIYSDKLVNEGIVSTDDVKTVKDKYEKICEEAFDLAKKETHIKVSNW